MSTPKQFIAVYECEYCRSEIEMWNCLVPYTTFFCEDCGVVRMFISTKMIHRSWEWDYIEEDEDKL